MSGKLIMEQYQKAGISPEVIQLGEKIEERLSDRFKAIDETAEYNQMKVILAMQKNKVSAECMQTSTGYGYNDIGRDTLEEVYADIFCAQAALVRPQITCGTQALALALISNLRPGDELLSASGKPYDTLEEVIGIRPSRGSLAEYGITYRQADLTDDGHFDFEAIRDAIRPNTRMVTIQRSRGYLTRPSFSVDEIEEVISFIRGIRSDLCIMIDNCYGEFVETREPVEAGADLVVGSLIKNRAGRRISCRYSRMH